jgi:hypothetical protein
MLWIRSQDQRKLLNAALIRVDEESLYAETSFAAPDDDGWFIGQFSTHEAALAELDAIERFIDASDAPIAGVYQVSQP